MQVSGAAPGIAVSARGALRVLALVEATRLTGVARNLIDYAALSSSGVGGARITMTLALIRRGARATSRPDPVIRLARARNIPYVVLLERHRYDRDLLPALRKLVDAVQPDIIETHHVKSHCLLALSGLWRRCRWVAYHHGYTQTDLKVRTYNQVDRWSLRRAAHVVTTSEPFAAVLTARGVPGSRITVLHCAVRASAVDPRAAVSLRRSLGLADHDRVVLSVGRLSREKGHGYAIRAAAAWQGRARLVIVGDGRDRRRLERLASRLGLDDAVIFAGLRADVAPFYAIADVFILPSLSEGSPNVLLEAMAARVPVVATSVGGVPEIVCDGVSALLGPPKDARFLGRAVTALLDDRALAARLADAAQPIVETRHTPEQRAALVSRLYVRVNQSCGRTTTTEAFAPLAGDQI